jgi:CubicO group peptidase (beta-lactamase class C family)
MNQIALRKSRIILALCGLLLLPATAATARGRAPAPSSESRPAATGTDTLSEQEQAQVDQIVGRYLANYQYISIALVDEGQIVYVGSYGRDRLGAREVYASVSKPVTATITMILLEQGTIGDLDDPISAYTDRFDTIFPPELTGEEITFRQLLSHQSGLPGQAPLVLRRPWPFLFTPGTDTSYSTYGYGLLGAVLEEITGEKYGKLVQVMIGDPVGAASFRADDLFFDTPGGRVWSTIEDMARFAIGISEYAYFSEDLLRDEVLHVYGSDTSGEIGLGWYVADPEACVAALYHAGSNGRPRAFIAVKPFQDDAVCIAGRARRADGPHDFGQLAIDLMELVTAP